MKEFLPACKGLTRPYPETRSDTDNKCHKVLYYEDLELWFPTEVSASFSDGTGYGVDIEMTRSRADLHVPGQHPVVEVGLLVEETSEDDEGGECVQHGEHANAHHQLLEFVRFGAVVLHDRANTEQRHEAGQEEHGAQNQVHEQRRQDEPAQRVHVPETHVTDATQDVACNNKTVKFI